MKRRAAWLAAALLLLGAVLRLARPELVAFKLDEAKFIGIIDAAASGQWPTSGAMSSWGILQPPLRAYLLAPARWVTSDVSAVVLLVGLLSLANLVAIGLAARRFSLVAAIAATGLAAASPWVLHFGRSLWDAPIQVFGTLALLAALRAIEPLGAKWTTAVVPLLVLQGLTHLTAWSVLPIAAYLAVRFPVFRTRWSAAGLLLGLLFALPYVLTLFGTRETLGNAAPGQEGLFSNAARAVVFGLWFVSGADLQSLLGAIYAPTYRFSNALAVGPFLAGGLLAAGVAACLRLGVGRGLGVWGLGPRLDLLRRVFGRGQAPALLSNGSGAQAEILLVWTLLPLLATMVLPGQVFVHYLQVWGGGAPFVLMGLGCAWLWERLQRRWVRASLLASLLVVAVVQGAAWISLLRYFERLPDTAVGPTLGAWQGIAFAARGATPPGEPLQLRTDGDAPAYQDKPAVLSVLLGADRRPVFMHRDTTVLTGRGASVFVVTPPREEPGWGFEPLTGLTRLAETPAGTSWFVPRNLSPLVRNPLKIDFDDGIGLRGYDLRRVGESRADLVTYWVVTNPGDRANGAELTAFVHLEDASGRRVAQDDGLDWPSDRWRAGDWIAQRSSLDIAPLQGDGTIRIGVYSRKDLQRAHRLDDGGDSALIGPFDPRTLPS